MLTYVMTVVFATKHSPRWIPTLTIGAQETAVRLLKLFFHEYFPTRKIIDRHGDSCSVMIS